MLVYVQAALTLGCAHSVGPTAEGYNRVMCRCLRTGAAAGGCWPKMMLWSQLRVMSARARVDL